MKYPRLVLKTHREISRPGIFTVLIKHCTKPSASTFVETIGDCLAGYFPKSRRAAPHRDETVVIDKAGGKYCGWMAQYFGLLTGNLFWSWKGWAIDLTSVTRKPPEDYLELTEVEKILYFRYYLEAQGPLMLKVSQFFQNTNEASRRSLLEEGWIEDIVVAIYRDYLQLTDDLAERTRMRQKIESLNGKRYDPTTRTHKVDPIVYPMVDLGLLRMARIGGDVMFSNIDYRGRTATARLVDALCDTQKLEKRLAEYDYFKIIADTYAMDYREYEEELDKRELTTQFATAYRASIQGQILVPISLLVDVLSVRFLQRNVLIRPEDVDDYLDDLAGREPLNLQFQVDYDGRRAFVKLSEDLLNRLVGVGNSALDPTGSRGI